MARRMFILQTAVGEPRGNCTASPVQKRDRTRVAPVSAEIRSRRSASKSFTSRHAKIFSRTCCGGRPLPRTRLMSSRRPISLRGGPSRPCPTAVKLACGCSASRGTFFSSPPGRPEFETRYPSDSPPNFAPPREAQPPQTNVCASWEPPLANCWTQTARSSHSAPGKGSRPGRSPSSPAVTPTQFESACTAHAGDSDADLPRKTGQLAPSTTTPDPGPIRRHGRPFDRVQKAAAEPRSLPLRDHYNSQPAEADPRE